MDSNLEAVTNIVVMCNHTLERVDRIEIDIAVLRKMVIRDEGVAVLDRIDGVVSDIRIAQLSIKSLF